MEKDLKKQGFYVYKYSITDTAGELSFLPALQRRRLSPLSKIAFTTMFECFESFENSEDTSSLCLCFASQYGEFDRLLKLIEQYKTENEVSPGIFSLSVHNSTIGGFSLVNHITTPYNSLSAGKNTLSAGLLDAAMSLDGANNVLFCYADSKNSISGSPELYRGSISCLLGRKYKQDAIEVFIEQENNLNAQEDEYESFTSFLKGTKKEFRAGYYTLKRARREK